jgi:putative redox protein
MSTRTISIGELKGYIDSPDHYARIRGVIIMIPCFTCVGTLDGLKNISDILTDRGYATLRIDMSGVGLSKGDFSQQTIHNHVTDLIKFTDYAATEISSDIIYVGHGIGGVIGIIANETNPVKGIITLSTPLDNGSYDFRRLNLDNYESPTLAKVFINDNTIFVRKDYMDGLTETQIIEMIDHCMTPVLSIFFEEEDESVPYKKTMNLIKTMHSPIETLLLKKVTHFMDTDIESYYIGNLIDIWAQNKLNVI